MRTRSLNEALSNRRQKHLLVGDAFVDHFGLGCDLGWLYDKLIRLDKEYFHQLAVHRSETALERIIEQTTPLALLTVRDEVVRVVALKRLTSELYPRVLAFIDHFETCHSPTLMPMVEIMSSRVLELNLKQEHGIELLDLVGANKNELDEVFKVYFEHYLESKRTYSRIHKDIEGFMMLSLSADLRHYDGKSTRRSGDTRAFGSKVVYSLNRYDWRTGNFEMPEGQWHWKCQPLEEVDGDLYMFPEDYLSLELDDRVSGLLHSNDTIATLNFVMRDDKVVSFSNGMPLEETQHRLHEVIEGTSFMDEGRYGGTNLGIQEGGLVMGGVK